MPTATEPLRFLAALAASLVLSTSAHAATPTAELKQVERKVRTVLTTAKDQAGVKQQLKPVVDQYLDFDMLGQRSLVKHWPKLSSEQQTTYLLTLRELIEAAYLSRVSPSNKAFTITYVDEKVSGADASVTTKVTSGKSSVELGFKLVQVNGAWKAYDMVIDQVSLIRNYRTQFNRILRTKSFDYLIKKMQAKAKKLQTAKQG